MSETGLQKELEEARQVLERLQANMVRVIRGKDEVVRQVLVALAAGGHVLIEDLPGLGKTTLAYALARSLDCGFSRIQFTSDLLPGDVTGVSIYDERLREFVFKKGPVFSNIVLADEINRATPKTQSALLEVMDRARVTVDGEAHATGAPFMVFATQNPVDYEGAFPLPESQMDRFLLRLQVGYPDEQHELEILRRAVLNYDKLQVETVATKSEVLMLQSLVPRVFVEDTVLEYIQGMVASTRSSAALRNGASVRGSLSLKLASQARAVFEGRDFVLPEDVRAEVLPVLGHRLCPARPSGDALEERRQVEAELNRLLAEHPSPV